MIRFKRFVCFFFRLRNTEFSSHLALATARLLHRITELRILVLLLQLLEDLLDKVRPLGHLLANLTRATRHIAGTRLTGTLATRLAGGLTSRSHLFLTNLRKIF